MVVTDRGDSRRHHTLAQELAVVRTILGRLDTKLLESDTDHVPKEDDRELRRALEKIGDDRLTRLALDYAVCVRGLTGPMVSRTWKEELAEEAEEAHRLVLDRLQRLERLAGSPLGRFWLRLQNRLRRLVRTPSETQHLTISEKHGHRGPSR